MSNYEVLTDQTAFNKVVKHLLKQGRTAMNDQENTCMYWRNKDTGLKCAIGCLIPKDEYHKGLEGMTAFTLNEENKLPKSLKELDLNLLDDLQAIHDDRDPQTWLQQLGTIAVKYSLSMPNG